VLDEINKIPELDVNESDIKVFQNNDLTEIVKECEWMFIHKV